MIKVHLLQFRTFLFSILLIKGSLLAQPERERNLSVRIDGLYGLVIPEYKNISYLVEEPVKGFEISLYRSAIGRNLWEQTYRYPEAGLTFQFTTLGNKKVFGEEYALFPYVQTALVRRPKFMLSTLFGLGLGYATRKFDLEDNYQNVSVGSHLNIHFNFKLGTRWKLSERFALNSGLSFTHYSNANMAEPNLGLNLLNLYTGINYAINPVQEFIRSEIPEHTKKHEFAFIYAAGGKHTRALQSTVYFTSSFSAEYKYHWRRKFRFGAGFDLSYDSATETEMSAPGKDTYKPIYDYRTGIHFSQELVYDRFSFILQEGFYIGLVDRVENSFMYNRAMLRWKLTEHWLINVSMRSHLHILDYPELGIGYYFTREK
jgi:hypothetical protein